MTRGEKERGEKREKEERKGGGEWGEERGGGEGEERGEGSEGGEGRRQRLSIPELLFRCPLNYSCVEIERYSTG